ncbi:MAG: ABC transporter permease [Reichenbachiella sp.]|uniref:ABC transporter permease n=1 Tax=Reichenbachiella sp. TaxID=2184521 RepID=UPI003297EC1A
MLIIRLIWESFRFAFNALRMNMIRTVLSFLGVTIGIFAIISVFTLVDSLQRNINNSLNFLGADNVILEKWPYQFGGKFYPWWKYYQRPNTDYEEFKYLQANLVNHDGVAIYAYKSNITAKQGSNSSAGLNMIGVSYGYKDINDLQLASGRYFSIQETENASNVALIGQRSATELFPFQSPLGQILKVQGTKFMVIGVIEEEGEALLNTPSNDDNILIPYKTLSKFYLVSKYKGIGSSINIKGMDDDPGQERLEGELTGLMRKKRGLRPKEENNFALNRPEAFATFLSQVFDILNLAGWIIGSFSILVGGFGIANIMFVSVRERTNIIGIQKSLGAKNNFILFQFLFESVFLSSIGGGFGILLVYFLTFMDLGSLELVMSLNNVLIGFCVSVIIGIISGMVPAGLAARMDPVVAIRS